MTGLLDLQIAIRHNVNCWDRLMRSLAKATRDLNRRMQKNAKRIEKASQKGDVDRMAKAVAGHVKDLDRYTAALGGLLPDFRETGAQIVETFTTYEQRLDTEQRRAFGDQLNDLTGAWRQSLALLRKFQGELWVGAAKDVSDDLAVGTERAVATLDHVAAALEDVLAGCEGVGGTS